jgi:gliding motility-associated-like protein
MKRSFFVMFSVLVFLQLQAQTPTIASSNVGFSNVYCSKLTVSWTSGDGAERIVIASEGSSIASLPSNDVYYLANDSFGIGHSFSSTQYVVYNGIGNTVTVQNLKANTTYYFSVFEYNRSGAGAFLHYLTSGYPEASVTTNWITTDFTIDDPYQCENVNDFKFTPSTSQSGSETIIYDWDFGDGQSSNVQSPNHTYAAYDIYDVKLTVSTTGCSYTHTILDTVAPLPIINFELNVDTPNNNQVQCFFNGDGSSNRFAFKNRSTSPPLPGTTNQAIVTWDFGDGTSSNNFRGRKVYTKPGVYKVVLTLNSTNNGADYCIDSAFMFVTVKPSPIDSTKIVFSDTAMCYNGNSFDFDHNSPDATATNTWTFGDGNTGLGRNVSHSYTNPGIYYVTLEVLDTAGCYDHFLDSVEVIAQPNNFYGGLKPAYCQGDAKEMLLPNLPGGYFDGDEVDNTTNQFNPVKLGLNTVRYIIQVGSCIDTFTQTTVVNPLPIFQLQNDTSICNGTLLTLSTYKGNSAIRWSTGDTDSFTSVNSAGVVWAERTELGCKYRDSVRVTVIDAPKVTLGNDSTLCGDGARVVNVTADEGVYTWNDGFVGAQRRITKTGFYQVTVTNKCGTASDDVDLTFLPYACDIFIPNAFTPNSDTKNEVFRPSGTVVLRKMQIYSRWGEMLYDKDGEDLSWDGMYEGEPAPQGHYFFVIWYYFPEAGTEVPKIAKGEFYLLR